MTETLKKYPSQDTQSPQNKENADNSEKNDIKIETQEKLEKLKDDIENGIFSPRLLAEHLEFAEKIGDPEKKAFYVGSIFGALNKAGFAIQKIERSNISLLRPYIGRGIAKNHGNDIDLYQNILNNSNFDTKVLHKALLYRTSGIENYSEMLKDKASVDGYALHLVKQHPQLERYIKIENGNIVFGHQDEEIYRRFKLQMREQIQSHPADADFLVAYFDNIFYNGRLENEFLEDTTFQEYKDTEEKGKKEMMKLLNTNFSSEQLYSLGIKDANGMEHLSRQLRHDPVGTSGQLLRDGIVGGLGAGVLLGILGYFFGGKAGFFGGLTLGLVGGAAGGKLGWNAIQDMFLGEKSAKEKSLYQKYKGITENLSEEYQNTLVDLLTKNDNFLKSNAKKTLNIFKDKPDFKDQEEYFKNHLGITLNSENIEIYKNLFSGILKEQAKNNITPQENERMATFLDRKDADSSVNTSAGAATGANGEVKKDEEKVEISIESQNSQKEKSAKELRLYQTYKDIVENRSEEYQNTLAETLSNTKFLSSSNAKTTLNIFTTEPNFDKRQQYFKYNLGIDLTTENEVMYKDLFVSILKERTKNNISPKDDEVMVTFLNRSEDREGEINELYSTTYNFEIIDGRVFLIGENGEQLSQINHLSPEAKEILKKYEEVGILYEILQIWIPHAEQISQSLLIPGMRSGTTIIPDAINKINSNFETLFEKLQKGESYMTEVNTIWNEINRAEQSKPIIGSSDMTKVRDLFNSNSSKDQKLIAIYNTMRYGGWSGNSEGVKNQVAEHLLRNEKFKDINDILEDSNTYDLIKNHNRGALEQLLGKNIADDILKDYTKTKRKQEKYREKYSEHLVNINKQRKEAGEKEISLNDFIDLNTDITIEELLKHSLLRNRISQMTDRGNENESYTGLYANISGLGQIASSDWRKISDNNIDIAIDVSLTLVLAVVTMGAGALAARGALAAATWGAKATRLTTLSHKAGKVGGLSRFAGASTVEGYAFYQGYNTMNNLIYNDINSLDDVFENSTNGQEILKTVAFMGVLRGVSGVMKNAEAAHLAKNHTLFRGFNNPKTGETLAFIGKMADKVPAGIIRNTGEILIKGGLVTGTSVGLEYVFEGEAEWTWEEYMQAVMMIGIMRGAGKINFSRKNGKVEAKVQAPKEQVGIFKGISEKVKNLKLPDSVKTNLTKSIIEITKQSLIVGGIGGTTFSVGGGILNEATGGDFTDDLISHFMTGFALGAGSTFVIKSAAGVIKGVWTIGKNGVLKTLGIQEATKASTKILPNQTTKILIGSSMAYLYYGSSDD